MQTLGAHDNSIQKVSIQLGVLNPEPFCCDETMLANASPVT